MALKVDNNGLNPFQYAASIGKQWHGGLDIVARLVPGWSHPGITASLPPFAISASSCNNLDTSFELLRFDASVLTAATGQQVESESNHSDMFMALDDQIAKRDGRINQLDEINQHISYIEKRGVVIQYS